MARHLARSLSGRIEYRHDIKGVTGFENFSIAADLDGLRTLTAHCVMWDAGVQRDVVLTVGPDFRPREAFVRLGLQGRFQGAAWFSFSGDAARAEGQTQSEGRFSQSLALDGPADIFAPHPVAADAWQTAAADRLPGPGPHFLTRCFNPSPRADGASGPMLERTEKHMAFDGEEALTVAAGTFHCRRYRIMPRDFPDPLLLWVTGEDRLLVRCRWDYLQSTYDLAALQTAAAPV